ncbi:amidohydrolase [Phlyctema vagabunda]|uniref:Peptidase M20 domain-containing protein 2 n=1 Tax=Phlyctema vagabunda TaxID=108571 RepID=A0ABR4PYA9_9HELO
MTRVTAARPQPRATEAASIIQKTIDNLKKELRAINLKASSFLESLGFKVTRHAYGIPTSVLAEYGNGGRVITFNAEYDALPDIGHACGHNLIATSSIAAFLGVAGALKELKVPGRVRLLGTPAEEGGGGKIDLIDAGAYSDVDACLMVHPGAGKGGAAYASSLATNNFNVHFTGKPAHAAAHPWDGINALDAVVLAYNGISALRQQIKPYERIHGIIVNGGQKSNIIPARTSLEYLVRSWTLQEAKDLKTRVKKCFEGAAIATGCTVDFEESNSYAELRPNKVICSLYADAMTSINSPVACDFDAAPGSASTDMGNVTYVVPGFHGSFGIPTTKGAANHTEGFTAAARTEEAHDFCIITAKGMAIVTWKILTDDAVAKKMKNEFENDFDPKDVPTEEFLQGVS